MLGCAGQLTAMLFLPEQGSIKMVPFVRTPLLSSLKSEDGKRVAFTLDP